MTWFAGKKTYIVGGLTAVVGIAKLFGYELPGYEAVSPGELISGGLLALTFRNALNK